jgi:hypothetical protein
MPDWFLSVAEGSADRLHEPKTLLTSLPIINTGQRRAKKQPHADTIRQRVAALPDRLKLDKREGRKAAAEKYEPTTFPARIFR